MKKIILLTILCFSILIIWLLNSDVLLKEIGGNFKGGPHNLDSKISPAARQLIDQAFEDIPINELRDHHVHMIGTSINPRLLTWAHPIEYIKTKVYLSASKVDNFKNAKKQYIQRLVELIRSIPNHGKYYILAFDHYYHKDGTLDLHKSAFYTSNQYVFELSQEYPDIFIPVMSVHPYRKDALTEVQKWADKGVRWIKWLPNAQGMDASDPQNDRYYQLMKKHNLILLTHVGKEQAIDANEGQALGNPLLFKRPLDMGITIVMAHCGSLGENKDFENNNITTPSFELFMRMMKNPKYDGLLYGDISAITQFNRLPSPLLTLLKHKEIHHRLINGSDYPLPGINMIIQTKSLVKYGFITEQERLALNEIYHYNPLLFDYVLKRTIKHPETNEQFNASVFKNTINPVLKNVIDDYNNNLIPLLSEIRRPPIAEDM